MSPAKPKASFNSGFSTKVVVVALRMLVEESTYLSSCFMFLML
ncbi:hypothetical protein Lalb_Chr20g0116361 [Lupinus albus]|uniref:Uncharacterized protein n=1 Tax=Lupinus albus TaxID=3870 RepID=A0A6A4NC20_LUPAL|nr:hypothetical protein Lalb_Chr20g0116361 [Lupinus albus]